MRNQAWLPVMLFMLFCGCGDNPSSPGPAPEDDAVPTTPGVPDGAATTALIGAAGGTLVSADAGLEIEIPAGALTADTDIGIQPITNTAWGGIGKGYRLTPDSLSFAAPISLVFTIPEETAASIAFAFLDVAYQDDAGFWYVLKNETVDEPARTLTATTTHFSDYSPIAGVQIEPLSASVPTGQTLALSVRYCVMETSASDPDLVALVATCDGDLAPLGTFTNWSVNGVVGGSAASGTISPGSEQHAAFTAPATVPGTNPVAVSVQTTFEGQQALLVSNVTITTTHDTWAGNALMQAADGSSVSAAITWNYNETNGSLVDYYPSGQVTYTPPPMDGDCAVVSVTPSTHTIAPDDGFLSLDVSASPMSFFGDAVTVWPAVRCISCPPEGEITCGDTYVGGQWMSAFGLVSPDGNTITGVVNVGAGYVLSFTFTRQG
jgi:hypothetical protein